MKSTNGGDSWTEEDESFSDAVVKTIAVDPENPSTLYAGANVFGALYKSTDAGTSWALSNSGFSSMLIQTIAFDAQNPSSIYAGAGFGGFNKSTDGGQTWEVKRDINLNGFSRINDIVVDPVNPMNLYAATEFGFGAVWSDDGGDSWNLSNTPVAGGNELRIHPANPSTLYLASSSGKVFKSTNRGRDWVGSVSGLPNNVQYTALAVDPSNGNTLYAGTTPGFGTGTPAVYKSTDGGATWADASNGLDLVAVTALEIDPGNPSTLYAGGQGRVRPGNPAKEYGRRCQLDDPGPRRLSLSDQHSECRGRRSI